MRWCVRRTFLTSRWSTSLISVYDVLVAVNLLVSRRPSAAGGIADAIKTLTKDPATSDHEHLRPEGPIEPLLRVHPRATKPRLKKPWRRLQREMSPTSRGARHGQSIARDANFGAGPTGRGLRRPRRARRFRVLRERLRVERCLKQFKPTSPAGDSCTLTFEEITRNPEESATEPPGVRGGRDSRGRITPHFHRWRPTSSATARRLRRDTARVPPVRGHRVDPNARRPGPLHYADGESLILSRRVKLGQSGLPRHGRHPPGNACHSR